MPVGKCFSHLLCNPEAVRMSGHIEVQNAPSIVSDHEEAIKKAERECWHGEEIHRSDHFTMVTQKCFPSCFDHEAWVHVASSARPFSRRHQIQAAAVHRESGVHTR